MNNVENSSRIQTEGPRHPGDVFMMLAPDGKVQVASANGRFFKNFEHFMFHCATALLNQMRPPYGNSFFVHWRIDNPASVWADYENISVYPRRLLEAIRDQGLQPRATKRLYPLLYGIQRGCDAGQIPDLYDSSDYQERVRLYEGSNAEERPLSYRGIETDAGVLLFNSTAQGEALYGEYLHFLAGHFYDPRLDLTFVRTLELLPEETLRSKINPPVNLLGEGRMEAFCHLPSVYYAERDQLGIYTELRCFDLTPKEANLVCLTDYIGRYHPGSVCNSAEGNNLPESSSEKTSRRLEIASNIIHNNNKIGTNSIKRNLPDVAGRLAQHPVKKKGIVR